MADLLWEDRTTQQALSNLRTALARLRKQVGNDLVITRKTLALAPASQHLVDSIILLQSLANGQQIDAPAQARALQRAP